MKRIKITLIGTLVVLGVVLLVAIFQYTHFLDIIPKDFYIRKIIRIAKQTIPLKNSILRRTARDKLDLLKVDKSRGEWTLLVIPDTQNYVAKETQHKAPLSNMADAFDWIVLIADDLNIKMVQGLGDIT